MIQKLCLNNLPMLANQAKAHKSEEWQKMEKKIKENILSAQTKQKSTMTRSMLVERYLTLEHLY